MANRPGLPPTPHPDEPFMRRSADSVGLEDVYEGTWDVCRGNRTIAKAVTFRMGMAIMSGQKNPPGQRAIGLQALKPRR